MRKYVLRRSKRGENESADMVDAALISDSPVVRRQTEPSWRQCASGNIGENPGTVMFFWRRRVPKPFAVLLALSQASRSGVN